MKSIVRNSALMALALAATVATTTAAHATGFAITPASQGQIGAGGAATGVSNPSNGYNWVYNSATASKTTPGPGGVSMDPATSTDTNAAYTSNGSTGVLAMDGDYGLGVVDVELTGLTAGTTYALTFDFAEDQQLWSLTPGNPVGSCANGGNLCDTPFMADLTVGSGATQSAANNLTACTTGGAEVEKVNCGGPNITQQTFSGWTTETGFDFTANSSGDEWISFLASSSDANVPSFALVDAINYSVAPTPEPSSLLLLGTGLAGLSGLLRSRFKKSASAVV